MKFDSFAEMEDFALDVARWTILAQGQKEPEFVLLERIAQWKVRTRKEKR